MGAYWSVPKREIAIGLPCWHVAARRVQRAAITRSGTRRRLARRAAAVRLQAMMRARQARARQAAVRHAADVLTGTGGAPGAPVVYCVRVTVRAGPLPRTEATLQR